MFISSLYNNFIFNIFIFIFVHILCTRGHKNKILYREKGFLFILLISLKTTNSLSLKHVVFQHSIRFTNYENFFNLLKFYFLLLKRNPALRNSSPLMQRTKRKKFICLNEVSLWILVLRTKLIELFFTSRAIFFWFVFFVCTKKMNIYLNFLLDFLLLHQRKIFLLHKLQPRLIKMLE